MEQQRIERKPNPSQLAFIEDDHPFILLHASAGTGKTYAIAEKVRRALAQGVKGEEILCLTFTEKGAKEMKEDICDTVEEPVGVYTIHGYCLRLLREAAKAAGDRYADHSVKDETDCMDFIVSDVAPSLLECVSDRLLFEKLHRGLHELRDFEPIAFHPLNGPVWRTESGYVDFFGNDISAEQADSL
ncbi:MAG: UvrD-helicase domain-containing protein, partial [Christensenellaceae bacterium]